MQLVIIISLAMALLSGDGLAAPPEWVIHASPPVVVMLTVGAAFGAVLLCIAYNVLVARRVDRTGRLNRRRYRRGMFLLACLCLAIFAVQLFCFRWPVIPLRLFRLAGVPVVGELAVWCPFLFMLLGFWWSAYLVDIRVRLLDIQRRLATGLPVYAPGGADRTVWTLRQFLTFQVRFNLLLVLLPLVAILLFNRGLSGLFDWLEPHLSAWGLDPRQRDLILGATLLAAVLTVLVLSPPLLAVVFSTRPLPRGDLLDKLHQVLARAGARVRRILLWNTHGMVSNAAVMGLWGRLRYVMLSDGLVETLPDEQIEGVFGHELGHVVHRHIFYYLMFIFSLLAWVSILLSVLLSLRPVARLAARSELAEFAMSAVLLAALAAATLLLFGWLSRRFERQADLTGAQAITLGDLARSGLMPAAAPADLAEQAPPAAQATAPEAAAPETAADRPETAADMPETGAEATQPDADAPQPQAGAPDGRSDAPLNLESPPHPGAVEIYIAALDRIAELNGIDREQRTWRHGSIMARGRNLRRLCRPEQFHRFQFRIAVVKLAIVAMMVGAVAMALLAW